MPKRFAFLVVVTMCAAGACQSRTPVTPPPPHVVVSRPLEREVVEWDEYTARVEAVDSVEVRARVSGYLDEIRFKDGTIVHKGDVLFVIDPRPYVAILHQAEADLALAKARLSLAVTRRGRAEKLVLEDAVSKEEADTRVTEERQAAAQVEAAAAALESARLNVEFTEVRAAVSGRVGRKLVTEGNLISGGAGTQSTLLTTIVSLDPLYVYFEADERSYLKYVRLAREGSRPSSRDKQNPVEIGFADEDGFPHHGFMDFVDNRLDPNTGTMIGRAVLPNPDLSLTPGLFARLRLVGSGQYPAVLIPDEAVLHDQSRTFVFVIDAQNEAQYRLIVTGPLIDGLRVARQGVSAADRIVVSGVQRVHPGTIVNPEERTVTAADQRPTVPGIAPTTTLAPVGNRPPPPVTP